MESKRTATTYFIPPGKFLLMENALGNPDLIQSSVSSDCRVTIVDSANFPLDELEQWPTFRLTSADIKLKLGDGAYYIYIVVPTPDNTESTSAFISYNTALVDRDGYQVIETEDKEGNPKLEKGELLGKSGFKYYQCGVISARGGNASAITAPAGQGRLLSVDLGVNPQYANLDKKVDWDFFFSLFKPHYDDPKNPTKLTWIEAKSHMGIQGGVTMYAMDKDVDVPSLASGLPFDRRTIWYNPDTQQIEVIGGTGGGSGEGVSNFWDLSGIPSWITISKPKYTYSEIGGTPDLSAFATQDWIISQGYASAEELKKYIPISGYTEVSGEKNFTGGLKVNGSPIYYDTEKKYWKLEGDLLVTGGVTMYGVDSTDIPSLINSLPVATTKEKGVAYFDPDFFSVSSDGKVSFIGETGGGLDIVSLQNYLTQNSYLNATEGDNRYLKLSGGTISGNYGALTIHRTNGNSSLIKYSNTSGVLGYLGFNSSKEPFVYKGTDTTTSYKIWHTGNDGEDSGLNADLLDGYHRNSFCSLYGGLHIDATSSYNVDLNTLTSADSYYQATSANAVYVTNKPSGVTAAFRLYVSNSNGTNSTYLRQRIQQYNSADIYERVSTNSGSTWTDWTLVQTKLSSFTASSTLDGTLSITLGSLSAKVDNLYAKTTRFFANQWNYDSGTVFDLNEWDAGGIVRCYGSSGNLLNRPDGFTYGNVLSLSNGTKALTGQLAWAVNHNSTTDTTKALWFRASDSANGFTYSPWRKIAFADLFLPLTGGTLSGALFLKNDCKLIGLDASGGEAYIAYVSPSNNVILGSVFHNAYLSGTTVNIRYGGTSGIYLDSSGNVGIGTTSPAYKLDVNGTIYGDLKMKTPRTIWGQSFDGTSNIKGNIYVINEDANTINQGSGKIKFNSFNATNVDKDKQRSPYIQAIYQSTYGRKRLSVFQSNAANYEDDFVEVFTILPNGNAGIGTSSPSYKLHVTGDIFTSSKVNVNGIEISKSKDDVLYIDGNVVVRGGVTMYGTNSTTAPSILDSLPIASTTTKGVAYFDSAFFSVGSDGKVSFIGKTDGFNATELQNYLTQNSYLNTTQGDDRYLKLSGGAISGALTLTGTSSTTARIIMSRSSYNYINYPSDGSLCFGTSNSSASTQLFIEGATGDVGIGTVTPTAKLHVVGNSHLKGTIYVTNTEATTMVENSGKIKFNSLNVRDDLRSPYIQAIHHNNYSRKRLSVFQSNATNYTDDFVEVFTILPNGNVGIGTPSPSYKLHVEGTMYGDLKMKTPRTIWGQSFDGAGDVSGDLTLNNKSYIMCCDTSGNSYNTFGLNASNSLLIGYGTRGAGYETYIYGSQLRLYSGTSGGSKFILDSSGNVGIGTTSPSSLLDVNGDASITGQLKLPTTGSGVFSNPQILLGSGLARIGVTSSGFLALYAKTTIRLSQDSGTAASTTGLWVYTGGFVGVNNSKPTHTLDVSGSLHASENAIIDGTLNVTGVSTLTEGIVTNDIHGNGNALYLGNSGNTSYIYIREDMASSSDSWSIKLGGEATFGSLTSNGALTVGDSATLSSTLTVTGATTLSSTLTGNYWYLNNSASNPYLRLNRASSSSSYWYIQSVSGYISIGGAKSANSVRIDASGNILAAGGITMYSQRSLKNIQDERGLSLDELRAIKPIRYTWKDNRDNRLHFGGIADDIQQVLPEVVYKTNDGVLTMDYGNAAFAIASSLIQPVVDHEKRIAILEEENKQLRREVERLKSA